jgi:hypothetical protein
MFAVAAAASVVGFSAETENSALPADEFVTKTLPAVQLFDPVAVLAVKAAFDAW